MSSNYSSVIPPHPDTLGKRGGVISGGPQGKIGPRKVYIIDSKEGNESAAQIAREMFAQHRNAETNLSEALVKHKYSPLPETKKFFKNLWNSELFLFFRGFRKVSVGALDIYARKETGKELSLLRSRQALEDRKNNLMQKCQREIDRCQEQLKRIWPRTGLDIDDLTEMCDDEGVIYSQPPDRNEIEPLLDTRLKAKQEKCADTISRIRGLTIENIWVPDVEPSSGSISHSNNTCSEQENFCLSSSITVGRKNGRLLGLFEGQNGSALASLLANGLTVAVQQFLNQQEIPSDPKQRARVLKKAFSNIGSIVQAAVSTAMQKAKMERQEALRDKIKHLDGYETIKKQILQQVVEEQKKQICQKILETSPVTKLYPQLLEKNTQVLLSEWEKSPDFQAFEKKVQAYSEDQIAQIIEREFSDEFPPLVAPDSGAKLTCAIVVGNEVWSVSVGGPPIVAQDSSGVHQLGRSAAREHSIEAEEKEGVRPETRVLRYVIPPGGTTLVFCSNGVIEGLPSKKVAPVVRDLSSQAEPAEISEMLVQEACARGSERNLTAMVVKFPHEETSK